MSDREVVGVLGVACLAHYREVTLELVEALLDSGLYDLSAAVHVAVLGDPAARREVRDLLSPFPKFAVAYESVDLREYEYPALTLVQEACRAGDCEVYYLHTKGVSHGPLDQHARYWRMLMLDTVVTNHEDCRRALRDHDAAGTNWRENHYSGNFWWARAEHVRRLPAVEALRASPRPISRDPVWNLRLQCEFWLGMAEGRFACLGVSGLDLYRTIRWPWTAADVVNALLEACGGDRYLELGFEGPSQYLPHVRAAVRHLVSPDPSATFRTDETTFFAGAGKEREYDIVLVDTVHEEGPCRRAIEAALTVLSPGGAVVVHDSNPPTRWHARPRSEFNPGTEWNGEVWRAVVSFRREHSDIEVATVDTDWGCTVIRPDAPALPHVAPPAPGELSWEEFEQNRAALLRTVSMSWLRRSLHSMPFRLGRVTISSCTDVLNCLVSAHGFERYLEIGARRESNFGSVIAPIRQSVDPENPATFQMTSDSFFAESLGCATYDLIFIDAVHEAEQCLRDIENALLRLSPTGCVVVHDTNPPTEWHQRPAVEYRPGEEWNGTCWKAVVCLRRRHPEYAIVTLDVDWGCTVIRRTSPTWSHAIPSVELTWEALFEHRSQLLNLAPPTWACLMGAPPASRPDNPAPSGNSRQPPVNDS